MIGKDFWKEISDAQDKGWEILNFSNAWRGHYDLTFCYLRKPKKDD
jgi:hypothetical protein